MKRSNKATAWIAAILVGLSAGAAGLYFYQQGLIPGVGWQTDAAGESPSASPEPSRPAAGGPAEAPSQPPIGATGAVAPPMKPMAVPSFDVVLVEPSGEGVIAGRAQPGWKVSVESGGIKVAEATADAQGEWSIVLEKPLPPGDNTLSLKTASPDGTSVLTSQDSVPIAVGKKEEKVAAADTEAKPEQAAPTSRGAELEASAASEPGAETPRAPSETTSAVADSAPKPQEGPKAKVTLNTVDYQDIGADAGKLRVTGTTDPGQPVSLSFDGEALANVTADDVGVWRFEIDRKLGLGQHTLRAERYDSTKKLAARAMVTFERATPALPAPVVAEAKPAPRVAAVETGQAQSAQDASDEEHPETYVIRRGDTLWGIAKRYLGGGWRYSSIFQGNREVIRNPNLILPQQKVKMPKQP